MWLRAPIEERDADETRRMSGGKRNTRGTPQGGFASPLLANIYMNRFLKHWRLTECGDTFRAHVVSYADDFVILSRGRAAEALAWTKAVMTKLGLTINEAKTSLRNARQERFDFLEKRAAQRRLHEESAFNDLWRTVPTGPANIRDAPFILSNIRIPSRPAPNSGSCREGPGGKPGPIWRAYFK